MGRPVSGVSSFLHCAGREVRHLLFGVGKSDGEGLPIGGWGIVHCIQHYGLADGAKTAGANLVFDGCIYNVLKHIGINDKLNSIHLEEPCVLLYKCILWLGEDIEKNEIKAKFEDGILKLSVPKKDAKPKVEENRYITIEG